METVRGALAVLAKDFRSEFRTRYALSAILLFAVASIAMMSFVLRGQVMEARQSAALVWIVIFFAAITGLARPFVQEAEAGTELFLRQAARAESVWLGKMLYSLLLMAALEIVVFPLYSALLSVQVQMPLMLIGTAAVGAVALAISTTIVGAMVSKANARATIFAVAALPLMLPALIFLVEASAPSFGSADSGGQAAAAIKTLISYSGILGVLSWMLFPVIWQE